MPKMISNTTCLIVLDNSGILDILKELYSSVIITKEVLGEFGKPTPAWIEVKEVKNRNYVNILNNFIDLGEASTIALNLEIESSKLILDDMKARKTAEKMKLDYTGTLGVLLKAKERRIITNLQEILVVLKSNGFRISEKIEKKALILAGEIIQ